MSTYGIFLFVYKIQTGSFIEIPGLTINYHDFGGLDYKHNDRGGFFKLISTYNNGNIYGVSILMLLPFTELIVKKKFRSLVRLFVFLSLFLTLSRTVWIGMFVYIILSITRKNFIILTLLGLLSLGGLYLIITSFITQDILTFILSKDLGGRLTTITDIKTHYLFWNFKDNFNGISEITYAAVYKYFGLIGLILFIIHWSFPLIFTFKSRCSEVIILRKSIIIYLIIAGADGAFQYIPVMLFFWMVYAIIFEHKRFINLNIN